MTLEEAIKTIQVALAEIEWNYPMNYTEAFETAIEALEMQIPKKPIPAEEQNIWYVMKYTCPSCGKHFTGTGIAKYCYHCGQALDWSGWRRNDNS